MKQSFYNPIRSVRPTQRMLREQAERKARRAQRLENIKFILQGFLLLILFIVFFYVCFGLAVAYNL